MARAGNTFDAAPGAVRANVAVGYFFTEGDHPRFVAFHLLIDDLNRATPVSVLYGDAEPDTFGSRVWVGPSPLLQNIQVFGSRDPELPNIVQGLVTATALASDRSSRVVEFSFRLALLDQ